MYNQLGYILPPNEYSMRIAIVHVLNIAFKGVIIRHPSNSKSGQQVRTSKRAVFIPSTKRIDNKRVRNTRYNWEKIPSDRSYVFLPFSLGESPNHEVRRDVSSVDSQE